MPNSLISAMAAGTMALSGGGSGLLSIPNAGLMSSNTMEYQHTNGLLSAGPDTQFGALALDAGHTVTDHFQFSVVPNLEFGGRLTTVYNQSTRRRDLNDLSGHFKFQLFQSEHARLAVGMRDLAGEVQFLSSAKFVVADFAYEQVSLTAGWGQSDEEHTALQGAFGGISYRPYKWVTLLADYDAVATRLGAQLQWAFRDVGFFIKAAHSTDDYQEFHYAAGLQLRLGHGYKENSAFSDHSGSWWTKQPKADSMLQPWAADEVARYRHHCDEDTAWWGYNVPVVAAACGDAASVNWQPDWRGLMRPYNWHLEGRIHPVFGYALGTEYGRLDYSLVMRGSLQWHLPAGFNIFGAWDGNVLNSDDYRRGGQFERNALRSGPIEYAAQYTAHALPGQFFQLTGGKTAVFGNLTDFSRVEVASHWLKGRLALDYSVTHFGNTNGDVARYQRLAKVFGWLKPARYAVEVTRGDFLFGDTGYRAELFAYIDRTRLGLFYKRGFDAFDFEAVGVTFNFAMSPRRSIGNRWASLKANPQFQVPIETQINDKVGNFLRPGFLREFVPQRQLVRDVLDRWRMSPSYIGGK